MFELICEACTALMIEVELGPVVHGTASAVTCASLLCDADCSSCSTIIGSRTGCDMGDTPGYAAAVDVDEDGKVELPSRVGDSGRGTSFASGVPVAVQNDEGDVDSSSISSTWPSPSMAWGGEGMGMGMGIDGEGDIYRSVYPC